MSARFTLPSLSNKRLILASGSPRRRELLEQLGIPVEFRDGPGIREDYPLHLKGEAIALYLAEKKAAALPLPAEDELLITADTLVWKADRVLPKPADRREAIEILQSLSGERHTVTTGVCLRMPDGMQSFTSSTDVTFSPLTEEEIHYYVDNYLPYDKAGAYGIQEWIGLVGVESITGSYFNVMGLPIQHLYRTLKHIN